MEIAASVNKLGQALLMVVVASLRRYSAAAMRKRVHEQVKIGDMEAKSSQFRSAFISESQCSNFHDRDMP